MKENENKREKKFSKKKVMVVTGMALLLALVGYAGGSTYARYLTSQSTQSETATVAKWGYVVSANASKLFATEYKNGSTATAQDTDQDVLIQSGSQANGLVAPGTSGEFSFTIAGQAEVLSALDITLTGDVVTLSKVTPGANPEDEPTVEEVYTPIKWTLQKKNTDGDFETVKVTITENQTQTTIFYEDKSLDEIKTYLDTLDQIVEPNVESTANGIYKLLWDWDVENTPVVGDGSLFNNKEVKALDVVKVTKEMVDDPQNPGGPQIEQTTRETFTFDTNYDSILGLLKDGYEISTYEADLNVSVSLKITIKQLQREEVENTQRSYDKWAAVEAAQQAANSN